LIKSHVYFDSIGHIFRSVFLGRTVSRGKSIDIFALRPASRK